MVRIFLALVLLLSATQALGHNWKPGKNIDEFDGDDTYFVMLGEEKYASLSLYCTVKSPRLSILYVSDHKVERGISKHLPRSGKIYIKVDDRPVREVYGTLERAPSPKRTWVGRSVGVDHILVRELGLASRRISIAIGAGGFSQSKEFRARFKPTGTAKPLHALLKICK